MTQTICFAIRTILGGALLSAVVCAAAQTYPTKPVRLIVPLAAGGPSDIMARTVGQKLTDMLGQSVIVDNRPGAAGIIGHDITAKSAPDGYTILLVSNSFVVNPSLYSKVPHDTLRDFAPITLLAVAPYILTVHPSVPFKSVKELVAFAKSKPGQLSYGSGGAGTGTHMVMELFKATAGINILHVPYKGSGPAIADLLGGQVQMLFVNALPIMPHIRAGKLRALAVSSTERLAIASDIPTVSESGLPKFDDYGIFGIVAPAGTPRQVINRLSGEIVGVMKLPDVQARLASEGATVVASSPEEFSKFIVSEVAKWAKVIKTAGIRVE
ncbi:MAG: tripartite tricarboxylate transporter substrate binding protein [Gammaproteobacteria bacterium]